MVISRWLVLASVLGVPVAVLMGVLNGDEQAVLSAVAAFGVLAWLGCVWVALCALTGWAVGKQE